VGAFFWSGEPTATSFFSEHPMLILALTLAATTPALRPLPVQPTVADAARVALDDPTIVAIFDAANTYDIEASSLALKKANSEGVRNYATMLVAAHTDARKQGRDLAKKLGVTPTPPAVNPLAADHEASMKKLRGLSGAAFDRAFLESEVAYHKAVIGAVQTVLMPAIQNAELKNFVVKIAPVFVQHQMAGEKLLAALPR
jgi:putative membrane protein